jgi:formiminotetrahydrofolate cyclodeaminase
VKAEPGREGPGSPAVGAYRPVSAFLADLASGEPTPGGGAAAALSGALAAALVAMACRVTMARDASALGGETVASADRLRLRLTGLMTEDADAYRALLDARRSRGPAEALALALDRCTEVPVQVARAGRDVLLLGETVAGRIRPSVLADLAVATTLGWAALESAAFTARANLDDLPDTERGQAWRRELADLVADGQGARRRVADAIAGRIGPSVSRA